MMKKTVAIILTVVLLVCLAPIVELSGTGRVNSSDAFKITAKAAEIIDSGSCGDAVNYTFSSDGVLSIYGSGDMTKNNHSSEGFPWSEYRDEIQSVIIDDGVTSIGNYAFFHCSSLTSVTIPEGITSIGQAAFQDCRALPSILLPGSLTEIKQQAFYFCNQLTSIRIPSNVNKIDYSAFQFCFQLSEISFPENLLYLGDKVFDSTPWYNNQPDGIIYIGKCLYTYKGTMPENTTIEVEPGIMYIAAKAFEGRTELTNIVLPDSITTISTYAFYGCTGLTEIDIPEQVEVLSQNLFGGCIGLTDITIPGGITQIDNYVFNGCSNLEAIHFCGSECQWDKIIIAATNTEILQSVSISFVGAHVPGTPVETVITPADEEHEGEKRVTVICTVCGETVSETTEPIPATGATDDPGEDPGSDTGYLAGDIIEFGSYPQTRVTDESLIAELDAAATDVEWQSLGYEVLDQEPFAFYKDIELNGVRYRAQRYTAYRSDHSGSQGESTYSCPQYINGYQINTTFWFRYDPIQWKVLDPKTGLLFPEMILDAQAINRVAYNEAGEPHTGVSAAGYDYADAAHQYYLNNYAHSDVRTWLLDIFTQTAFTEQERTILQPVELDNSVSETENESFMQYSCENTVDAVFLLSYGESAEEAYFADNAARCRAGTDYAKAQGLYHYSSGSDYEYWYLRSPGSVAVYHGYIYDDGVISAGCEAVGTDIGICPGVVISLDADDALNAEEPDTPEEPDEPTPSPYDDFTFTYAERILTVSGRGTLPTVTSLAETPLAPFAEECHVLVLENGEKTVQSSAFAGFESLSMLIVNSPATIEAGAFADNNGLQTVICADTVEIIDNPFASDAGLRFYEPKDTPHTGALPVNCTTLPYFFSDGTLSIEGSVEMDSYDLLDLMAVMCSKYDDIRYVKFDSYTSLDIPFYVFDDGTGEYEPVENNTLNGVSFSISAYGETNWETISFNEFCERSQDGSLGTFYLVAQTEKGEEVQDTSIRILDQIRESIKRALKWIVSLLNYLFDILNKFGK